LIIIRTTRHFSLRAVFLGTSFFLFVMGLKFIGEGLQEFQERALIPYDITPVAEWLTALGLNPTWQALGMQLVVVLIASISLTVAKANK
jgi:high-affinity iron transporter